MKRVAIVGSHSATRDNAPWDDLSIPIWVINEAASQPWVKRWDACFQIHIPAVYHNPHNMSDPAHWRWLQGDHGHPIYMQDIDPAVPDSVRYPLKEIQFDLLDGFKFKDYFRASVCYALGLAIWQGYDIIDVYGVEAKSNTEYQFQRECVIAWIFYALGRGIKVNMNCAEGMFDGYLYGYDGNLEIKLDAYGSRIEAIKQDIGRLDMKRNRTKERAEKELTPENLQAYANALYAWAYPQGALLELQTYADKVKDTVEQEGTAILDRTRFEAQAAMARKGRESFFAEMQRTAGVINLAFDKHDQRLIESIMPQ